MHKERTHRLAPMAALLLLAVPVLAAATTGAPASAAGGTQTISGSASPMGQTNGTVETIAVSRGVVYVGGTFSSVRPSGAAAGKSETPRTSLAAFNASTGALVTSFNVKLNGRVDDLAVSPDGNRLYAVGTFTTVNGVARSRIAAINLPTGTLVTGFTANADKTTTAVAAGASTVYVSGDFTTVRGTKKLRFAALDAATGAVRAPFTADLDNRGFTIAIAPDGSRVLVGGVFTKVGGVGTGGMASVDPVSGAVQRWAANDTFPINTSCAGHVTDIVASGTTAYVTAVGDPPGCYEGAYSARISDGVIGWNSTCLGAAEGLTLLGGVLYKASHQHDCAFNDGDTHGGFVGGTSRDTFIWYRLTALDVADGSFLHWTPNTNATGTAPVGPHTIANDGKQLFIGGDFDQVNGVRQQGLARFAPGSGAAPISPTAPTVQSNKVGGTTVIWPAVYDPDSAALTYRLYRNGTLVSTTSTDSYPWSRPMMRYDDTGLAPGATVGYAVSVSDGPHTTSRSATRSVVVRRTAPPTYADAVRAAGASLYWRLGGTGADVADSSKAADTPGEQQGTVSPDASGALAGDGATRLDGTTGYLTSSASLKLTSGFTESLWFKTTSVHGGSLMSVTDAKTGVGTLSDRAITMDNNGNLVFSVHRPAAAGSPDPFGPGLNNVRLQGPIYNDGRWHQVVASWDGSVASLYVDGALSGTYTGTAGGLTEGYQRVGYTDLSREQAVFGRNFYHQVWPTSEHFDGSIDEVATFPTALSAGTVQQLFAAGVNGAP